MNEFSSQGRGGCKLVELVRIGSGTNMATVYSLNSNVSVLGTPEGKGVYVTLYPESSPKTDSI